MNPKFIICGMEHTGTTLISDLFRQIPGVDSGFECGVLLRNSPLEFPTLEPFFSNMMSGWGLTTEDLKYCCSCQDFDIFYERLRERSKVISKDSTVIFDKTPRYLSELSSVLSRSECSAIVSYKDPRAIVCSDFKRAKTDDFSSWYSDYRDKKFTYVRACYNEFSKHSNNSRVTAVGLEDLAMNSRATMERMFDGVGEKFDLAYAVISDLRYSNVKARTVSPEIVFEYRRIFSCEQQELILNDFGCFEAWVYD